MANSDNFEGFGRRGSKSEIETGTKFQPKFDKNGLIACIVTNSKTNEFLMQDYLSAQVLELAIESRDPKYLDRGASHKIPKMLGSPEIVEILTDCDQDAVHVKVQSVIREGFSTTEFEINKVHQLLFDEDDLIPCIAIDDASDEILMLGYMNETSLMRTVETGEAWYWSRSRQNYWKKGETSGQVQKIVKVQIDSDLDAIHIRVRVEGNGATCHLGYRSCFHRKLIGLGKKPKDLSLERIEDERLFNPAEVYKNS